MKKIESVVSCQLSVVRPICLCLAMSISVLYFTGCVTEYYEPQGSNVAKVNDKLYGPVKREGFVSWSNGIGKNLPLANPSFSVVGK